MGRGGRGKGGTPRSQTTAEKKRNRNNSLSPRRPTKDEAVPEDDEDRPRANPLPAPVSVDEYRPVPAPMEKGLNNFSGKANVRDYDEKQRRNNGEDRPEEQEDKTASQETPIDSPEVHDEDMLPVDEGDVEPGSKAGDKTPEDKEEDPQQPTPVRQSEGGRIRSFLEPDEKGGDTFGPEDSFKDFDRNDPKHLNFLAAFVELGCDTRLGIAFAFPFKGTKDLCVEVDFDILLAVARVAEIDAPFAYVFDLPKPLKYTDCNRDTACAVLPHLNPPAAPKTNRGRRPRPHVNSRRLLRYVQGCLADWIRKFYDYDAYEAAPTRWPGWTPRSNGKMFLKPKKGFEEIAAKWRPDPNRLQDKLMSSVWPRLQLQVKKDIQDCTECTFGEISTGDERATRAHFGVPYHRELLESDDTQEAVANFVNLLDPENARDGIHHIGFGWTQTRVKVRPWLILSYEEFYMRRRMSYVAFMTGEDHPVGKIVTTTDHPDGKIQAHMSTSDKAFYRNPFEAWFNGDNWALLKQKWAETEPQDPRCLEAGSSRPATDAEAFLIEKVIGVNNFKKLAGLGAVFHAPRSSADTTLLSVIEYVNRILSGEYDIE